mgnify:CR=1 FL=1
MTKDLVSQRVEAFILEEREAKRRLFQSGGLASDKTLRDDFAGQALVGLSSGEGIYAESTAKLAYRLADAMLEARKRTGEPQ